MLIETFILADLLLLLTKAVYTKVIDKSETHKKIINEGLYHLTTIEAANKIMESGYINPSNGLTSLGNKKCFFFPGIPNYINICINTANYANKYEMTAIKLKVNEEELDSFKQRSFSDNAIIYEGKCILPKDRCEIVSLVLDLDGKNIIVREKKKDEEYIPSNELIDALKLKEGYIYTIKNLLVGLTHEVKNFKSNIINLTKYSFSSLKKYKLYENNFEFNEVAKKR